MTTKSRKKAAVYPEIDFQEAQRYLSILDAEADEFIFQYYPDPKDTSGHRGHEYRGVSRLGGLPNQREQSCAIACTVNISSEGRKRSDDMTIRAVYCEADDGLPEGGFSAFPLEPTMIVCSSPGKFHVYWAVDRSRGELSIADFRQIIDTMVSKYGSDPGAKDPTRVLRLPGTWHQKDPDNPHMVRIIEASGKRYSPEDLKAAFPPVEGYRAKPKKTKQQTDQSIYDNALAAVAPPWGETLNALASISADDYDDWKDVGMALRSTYGDTDETKAVFHGWSGTSVKYDQKDTDEKWQSFSDPGERGDGIGIGTLFHLAKEHHNPSEEGQLIRRKRLEKIKANIDPEIWASLGASEESDQRATAKEINKLKEQVGVDLSNTASGGQIAWPEMAADGKTPKGKSQKNIKAFLEHHNITLFHNSFDRRDYVQGFRGETKRVRLEDSTLRGLWLQADRDGLKCSKDFFYECILDACQRNSYHSVLDYLDGLPTWDGKPRLKTWLIDYAGAEDTPYTRAVSVLSLIAAVRRVRQPGYKFDHMVVLEGKGGKGKSHLIRTIARTEWFSDSLTIGAGTKDTIEQTQGKWIIEFSELDGIQGRDVNKVKAMVSRQEDTARKAYGRLSETIPRQFTLWGTTNREDYLKDPDGNRRFLPVAVGEDIDLKGLKRDRKLLWAEAVHLEQSYGYLVLPDEVLAEAERKQKARLQHSQITDTLGEHLDEFPTGRITTEQILRLVGYTDEDKHRCAKQVWDEITFAMRSMGWVKKRNPSRWEKGGLSDKKPYLKVEGSVHNGFSIRDATI